MSMNSMSKEEFFEKLDNLDIVHVKQNPESIKNLRKK